MLSALLLGASMVAAIMLAQNLDPIPGKLIAYGRRIAISSTSSKILYTAEGRNSSVAITEWSDGAMEVDVNGHVEATTEPYDMKLQRMVGHLPGMLHPQSEIGAGHRFRRGRFGRHFHPLSRASKRSPSAKSSRSSRPLRRAISPSRITTCCTIPRTHIVFDDARHYLLTTTEKFDIIASDPLDVFVKGTAALYSQEYFESVKRHLKPGGMFTLYVPLYESDERTVKSELATFFEAFPYGTVWANTIDGQRLRHGLHGPGSSRCRSISMRC